MLTATIPDKQHTLWLHGNTLLKPMHSISPPNQIASEYAEVAQIMPKPINTSAPPEPYATVTLQRGAQSDDSCIKCSASPSSSEYNAPVREPINLCDSLPPPPDHPYTAYKPPNNMTIRTNPVAMSPQIGRRTQQQQGNPRWPTMPPPIPNFPQNWQQPTDPQNYNNRNIVEEENDYESGSVLYEQCCRPNESAEAAANYFNHGEPTEEYYRNINMEFLDEYEFNDASSPPPPCPDSYSAAANAIGSPSHFASRHANEIHQQQSPNISHSDQSPVNTRRTLRNNQNATNSNRSAQSSDESESDNNRWAQSRTRRSRSKSGDRKFRGGFNR